MRQYNPMQQYCEQHPIKLLSLPHQQHSMVQRLKIAKQQQQRSHTTPPNLNTPTPAHTHLTSFRLNTQQFRYSRQDAAFRPLPRSVELASTIHSKPIHEKPAKKLSILEEGQTYSRLSLLRELMQKHYPVCLGKITHRHSPSNQTQNIQQKGTLTSTIGRMLKRSIQRPKKGELKSVVIVSRVKNSKDLNLLIRKMHSCKPVPIS